MFLFAVLAIENLFQQPTVATLRSELEAENIPASLEKAYDTRRSFT